MATATASTNEVVRVLDTRIAAATAEAQRLEQAKNLILSAEPGTIVRRRGRPTKAEAEARAMAEGSRRRRRAKRTARVAAASGTPRKRGRPAKKNKETATEGASNGGNQSGEAWATNPRSNSENSAT